MLPKAHLTLHSRMSRSKWVITPSWLSGSWRSFSNNKAVLFWEKTIWKLEEHHRNLEGFCPQLARLVLIFLPLLEGNGNPLQCSCLENPRDGRAWWTAVCEVAQSRTLLKRLSSSSSSRDINLGHELELDMASYLEEFGTGLCNGKIIGVPLSFCSQLWKGTEQWCSVLEEQLYVVYKVV